MTLQQFKQFKALFLNTLWDTKDHTNINQCFDLAIGWCKYLGIPDTIFSGLIYASDIWNNPTKASKQYFDFIPNTPDGIPQAGDIVVFDGVPGHVSVADEGGNLNTFVSLDQNIKYDIQLITHNYDSPKVLGWLRYKGQTPTSPTDDCPLKLAEKIKLETFLNGEIKKKDDRIDALTNDINSKYSTIKNLNSTIENKNSQIAGLEAEKKGLAEQLSTCQQTSDLHLEQAKKVTELTNLVDAQEKSLQSLKAEIALKSQTIAGLQGKWDMIKLPYTKLLKKLLIDKFS